MKEIRGSAFEGCSSLAQITLPETLTVLGTDAFKNCSALTSLELPASLEDFYGICFEGCTSLTEIRVAADNPKYSSDEYGVLYNKDQTKLLAYPCGRPGDYTIANTTLEVSVDAFRACVN